MKKLISVFALVILTGCSAARDIKYAEYREITQDVCIDNQHEVLLAQHLYLHMLKPAVVKTFDNEKEKK
jgi:hypothetical protein